MSGFFAGTPLERPITCDVCEQPLDACRCPRDGDGRVRLPRDQTARIRCENRGKGKIATIVSGLEPSASNLPELLKTLQRTCGTGGSVQHDDLLLQGDHRETVAKHLRDKGYKVKVQ